MYICICNAVTESAIRKAVENGASNFSELSFATGCGTQCGSCIPMAREVLDVALAEESVAKSPVTLQLVRAKCK